MKRLLFIYLFLLLSMPIYSQTIGYRNDTDQRLEIGTDCIFEGRNKLFFDHGPWTGISLGYNLDKDTGKEVYLLHFSLITRDQFTFDKRANLYIKTFQDKVIIADQLITNVTTKSKTTDNSRIYYFSYPSYGITTKDIQTLMNEGVKKLSFMTTSGYHELNYEKDTIGVILKKEYDLLHSKTSFDEGF